MPIVVQCGACKKQFKVGDQLVGKRVKCPACQTPIVIPGGPNASTSPTASPGGSTMEDLLAEEMSGRHGGVLGRVEIKCPGCGIPVKEDAVLCIDCGYNFRTGKRIVPDTPAQRQARFEAREDAMRGEAPGAKKKRKT